MQSAANDSMLTLYRTLIALRRDEEALSVGDYRTLAVNDHTFAFERSVPGRRLLVALNFSDRQQSLPGGLGADGSAARVLVSTYTTDTSHAQRLSTLRPFEGIVASLT